MRIKPNRFEEENKSEVEEEEEDDENVADPGQWGPTIHQRLKRWTQNSKVLCLAIF